MTLEELARWGYLLQIEWCTRDDDGLIQYLDNEVKAGSAKRLWEFFKVRIIPDHFRQVEDFAEAREAVKAYFRQRGVHEREMDYKKSDLSFAAAAMSVAYLAFVSSEENVENIAEHVVFFIEYRLSCKSTRRPFEAKFFMRLRQKTLDFDIARLEAASQKRLEADIERLKVLGQKERLESDIARLEAAKQERLKSDKVELEAVAEQRAQKRRRARAQERERARAQEQERARALRRQRGEEEPDAPEQNGPPGGP